MEDDGFHALVLGVNAFDDEIRFFFLNKISLEYFSKVYHLPHHPFLFLGSFYGRVPS